MYFVSKFDSILILGFEVLICVATMIVVSDPANNCTFLTAFLESFLNAYKVQGRYGNVISFPSNEAVLPTYGDQCKFVVREEYKEIWRNCERRVLEFEGRIPPKSDENAILHDSNISTDALARVVDEDTMLDDSNIPTDALARGESWKSITSKYTIVTGTSGIGKSVSRYLYIAMWLAGEFNISFDRVIFNQNTIFYSVDDTGNVTIIPSDLTTDVSKSLLLLDPCKLLDGLQTIFCKMLIVFSSPSALVNQANKCSLRELQKYSITYVLKAFPLNLFQRAFFQVDPIRKEWFCWREGAEEYCVPRWLLYTLDEASVALSGALTEVTKPALRDFFESAPSERCCDARLPYRFCIIDSSGNKSWTVSGFISPRIEKWLLTHVYSGIQMELRVITSLLNFKFLKVGKGSYFEIWIFNRMQKSALSVEMPDRTNRTFQLKSMEFVTRAELRFIEGTLYKLTDPHFPSIEGYAVSKSMEDQEFLYLLLIQVTISSNHRPGRLRDVSRIISDAQRLCTRLPLKILFVYIAPSEQDFRLPVCETFSRISSFYVCRGRVDDSEFSSAVF